MKIARQVDLIARLYRDETDPERAAALMQERLFSYAEFIAPWAEQVAALMCEQASKADYDTWLELGDGLSKATRERLKTAAIGPVFDRLQAEQVDLITSLPREAAETVHEWTRDGLDKGLRYADIAKRIQNELGQQVEYRAVRVARTESARARSTFTEARAKAVGSTHYRWHTCGDGAVRKMHADLDGTIQAWASPPVCEVGRGGIPVRAHPGCVWNCFTGDTLVHVPRDVRKIIRAPFDGRVVCIRTSSSSVTVTPNHPMLTQRGWVPAGEINEGDYLLKPFRNAGKVVKPNEDDLVATFDEIFNAVCVEAETSPSAEFDFYGDIPNGDVDVVVTEGRLTFDAVVERLQKLGYLRFSGTTGIMLGVDPHVLHVSITGGPGERPSFIKGGSGHSEEHGFGFVTNGDVVLYQASPNGPAIDSEGTGQGQLALPECVTADDLGSGKFLPVVGGMTLADGGVYADGSELPGEHIGREPNSASGCLNGGSALYEGTRVLELSSRHFSGHVYTLETSKGWYGVTHDNFATRNCRCWAEPLFQDDLMLKKS